MKVHSIKRNFLVKLCISFAFILSVIAAAFCISPATSVSANTDPVMMSEGAQIRKIAPTGIRFSAYVSDTYFTDGVLNDGVEVGMDVSIVVSGETKTQTVSTETVKTEENNVWKWVDSDKEGYQKFQVAVWYSENATVEHYATDLTANAFVKVGDNATYANNAQTRSVAQVANAALTDNMLTETVDEYKDVLDSFVSATNALVWETPNVTLNGDELSWTGVTGAKGYFVTNEKETVHVLATAENANYTADLTEFAKDGVVSVTAYGDGTTATYTTAEDTKNYHYLTGDQIATFNHAIYAEDVVAGNPESADSRVITYFRENKPAEFDETKGDGGIATAAVLPITGFADVAYKMFVLSVKLSDTLDLTNNDGIEVKFQVASIHGFTAADTVYFSLLNRANNNGTVPSDYKTPVSGESDVCKKTTVGATEFDTLVLSSAVLKEMGYDGKTLLTFAVLTEKAMANTYGYCAFVYFDDISYCDMLDTPVVAIDGTTASWSAVEGAANYTVSVNGEETITTELSFDLSALTENANISVRANSTTDGVYSSPFSASVEYVWVDSSVLMDFTNATAVDNVVWVDGRNYNEAGGTTWKEAPNFANGYVTFRLLRQYYTSTTNNLSAFKVLLNKNWDSSKGGIEVRMYLQDSSMLQNVTVSLLEKDGTDWSAKGARTPNVTMDVTLEENATEKGGWVTLQVTAKQLDSLGYTNGDKEFIFGVFCESEFAYGRSVRVTLDYVKYYNN